jgi:hypothetical protein
MYLGKLAKEGDTNTILSLKESNLLCKSCGGMCHEILTVPKNEIGCGSEGNYKVIRCLNCIFFGAYYVYFEAGVPFEVSPPRNFEANDFIIDNGMYGSASIKWEQVSSIKRSQQEYLPIFSGGKPLWVQKAERPRCPKCKKHMDFILQISSEALDTTKRNQEFISDIYMDIEYYSTLYFFFCEQCEVSCSVTQCT